MTEPAGDGFPDESGPAAVSQEDGLPELHFSGAEDAAWRADFTGLLSLGYLDAWFDWCGHRIAVRTLTTDEELIIAQLVREYEGGMGGAKAYATAVAGICVLSVDHQPMPVPLGEHPNRPYQWALERFGYARRWYPPTIDVIFDAYLRLEARVREVMTELGKASSRAASATPGSSASPGSPSGAAS